jgi:hypothetical protein
MIIKDDLSSRYIEISAATRLLLYLDVNEGNIVLPFEESLPGQENS